MLKKVKFIAIFYRKVTRFSLFKYFVLLQITKIDLDENGVKILWAQIELQDTQSYCNAQNHHDGKVLQEMFCGKDSEKGDICPSTRGGALYGEPPTKNILGILSFGLACGQKDIPPVFIKVSQIVVAISSAWSAWG